jgi:hypothetical protein
MPKTNLEKLVHSFIEMFQLQSDKNAYVITAIRKNVGSNDNSLTKGV